MQEKGKSPEHFLNRVCVCMRKEASLELSVNGFCVCLWEERAFMEQF